MPNLDISGSSKSEDFNPYIGFKDDINLANDERLDSSLFSYDGSNKSLAKVGHKYMCIKKCSVDMHFAHILGKYFYNRLESFASLFSHVSFGRMVDYK